MNEHRNNHDHLCHQRISKAELLPVAYNTTKVRHEYLADFEDSLANFSLSSVASSARRVWCAPCRNLQQEEDDRKSQVRVFLKISVKTGRPNHSLSLIEKYIFHM